MRAPPNPRDGELEMPHMAVMMLLYMSPNSALSDCSLFHLSARAREQRGIQDRA